MARGASALKVRYGVHVYLIRAQAHTTLRSDGGHSLVSSAGSYCDTNDMTAIIQNKTSLSFHRENYRKLKPKKDR